MKNFSIYLIISICCSLSFLAQAQQKEVLTDTILVEGVCDMCQKRIEEAAFGKGVKFASWNKQTRQLAVAYRGDKTSLAEIEGRVAAKGHKTENISAKEEDYESLPDCCKYEHLHTH